MQVDAQSPFADPPPIHAIACPSTQLCIGVEPAAVVTSTAPTAGFTAWTATDLAGVSRFPRAALGSVSCASTRLCVITDEAGDVLVSTNPTGGTVAWRSSAVGTALSAVSCPSARLCVGVAPARS